MCGRYGADDSVNEWLKNRCRCLSDDILRQGDILPGETAPVIIAGTPAPMAVSMTWGMKRSDGSGLIINARKETLWEKPMFRRSIRFRRCLLPASRFYEWDSGKHKATFHGEKAEILFLAGIFHEDKEGGRFVIITAPADERVNPVHDRMPVRIPEPLIGDWLSDAERAREILDMAEVPVCREQLVELLSLWDQEGF